MTALVHGAAAAGAADEAADILFGGDPTSASAEALDTVAREVPTSRLAPEALELLDVLVGTGLATSKGDARRTLEGRGYRANGQVLAVDDDLRECPRLHGRWILLQRGKTNHHLVEVFA
jgi:tyrosyl-tRNA synthetase